MIIFVIDKHVMAKEKKKKRISMTFFFNWHIHQELVNKENG